MAFDHQYKLINEGGEDNKDEAQPTVIPVVTSWWKFLLCNLLAAIVGAGLTIFIARAFFDTHVQPSGNTAPSATTSIAASSVGISPTLSSDITIATPSVEHLQEDIDSPLKTPNMKPGEILDCGGSPADARAKGCVYDVMMQDWVPVPCYDEILTEKYLAQGNWTWYADGEGKTTLSDEVMRKGEHGAAWMSTSYHKAHCVFSWLKIIRALRNNKGISQELLSYDHVLHCSHGALKESSTDEGLGVQAPTNYAKCALYDTWKYDFIPDEHDSEGK